MMSMNGTISSRNRKSRSSIHILAAVCTARRTRSTAALFSNPRRHNCDGFGCPESADTTVRSRWRYPSRTSRVRFCLQQAALALPPAARGLNEVCP